VNDRKIKIEKSIFGIGLFCCFSRSSPELRFCEHEKNEVFCLKKEGEYHQADNMIDYTGCVDVIRYTT